MRIRTLLRTVCVSAALVSSSPSFANDDVWGVFWSSRGFNPSTYAVERAPTLRTAPLPVARPQIARIVDQAADRHGVPRHIAHAVVRKESNYNCRARNPSGATGLGQMLPNTFRSMGGGSIYNCHDNANASMRYLALALRRGGQGCSGVALYERGIYARPACTSYGRAVMRLAVGGSSSS